MSMTQITRRNLLKTGLVATAGLLASDTIFAALNVDAATPAPEGFPELPPAGTMLDPLKSLLCMLSRHARMPILLSQHA